MPDDAFTFRPVTDADLPFVLACQTSDAAAPWFAPLTLDQARARFGDRTPSAILYALTAKECGK